MIGLPKILPVPVPRSISTIYEYRTNQTGRYHNLFISCCNALEKMRDCYKVSRRDVYVSTHSSYPQIKHNDIQKQKREELERLHFIYESIDADGNRKKHVSPISAAGILNPNTTPPAPASTTPFPPTNPFENNGGPTPPPPASRTYRKSQPAWNAATSQTRNMMNQCSEFMGLSPTPRTSPKDRFSPTMRVCQTTIERSRKTPKG